MEISNYARFDLDRCIVEFDKALRILYGEPVARRPSPAEAVAEEDLRDEVRRDAAALMRVNHCGEMCAQALYQGQALASSNEHVKDALAKAALEEADHLAWSAQRVRELGGRVSVLNPLWYAGSLALGYASGRAARAFPRARSCSAPSARKPIPRCSPRSTCTSSYEAKI